MITREFPNLGDPIDNVELLETLIAELIPLGGGTIEFISPEPYALGCFEDIKGTTPVKVDSGAVTGELLNVNTPRFRPYNIKIPFVSSNEPIAVKDWPDSPFPNPVQFRHSAPFLTFTGKGDPARILMHDPISIPEDLDQDLLTWVNNNSSNINREKLNGAAPEGLWEVFYAKLKQLLTKDSNSLIDLIPNEDSPQSLLLKDWFVRLRVYRGTKLFHLTNYSGPEKSHPIYFRNLIFDGQHPTYHAAGWRTHKSQFDQHVQVYVGYNDLAPQNLPPLMEVMFWNCQFDHAVGDGLQIRNNVRATAINCSALNSQRGGITLTLVHNDLYVDDYQGEVWEDSPEPGLLSPLNLETDKLESGVDSSNTIVVKNSNTVWSKFNLSPNAEVTVDTLTTSRIFTAVLPDCDAHFHSCTFSRHTNSFGPNYWDISVTNFGTTLFDNCTFEMLEASTDPVTLPAGEGLLSLQMNHRFMEFNTVEHDWSAHFINCSFHNRSNQEIPSVFNYSQFNEDKFQLTNTSTAYFSGMTVTGTFKRIANQFAGKLNLSRCAWDNCAITDHYLNVGFDNLVTPGSLTVSGEFSKQTDKFFLKVGELPDTTFINFDQARFSTKSHVIKIDHPRLVTAYPRQAQAFPGSRTIWSIKQSPWNDPFDEPGLPGDRWIEYEDINILNGIISYQRIKRYRCDGFLPESTAPNSSNGTLIGVWTRLEARIQINRVLFRINTPIDFRKEPIEPDFRIEDPPRTPVWQQRLDVLQKELEVQKLDGKGVVKSK